MMNSVTRNPITAILACLGALVIGSAVVSPGAVAQGPQVTVLSDQPVADVVGEKSDPMIATLSPDGSFIGWVVSERKAFRPRQFRREVCTYQFSDESTRCAALPDLFEGVPYSLAWSPGGDYIAFT